MSRSFIGSRSRSKEQKRVCESCWVSQLRMPRPETFTFGKWVQLRNPSINFVYQGHRVNFKVQEPKSLMCVLLDSVCLRLTLLNFFTCLLCLVGNKVDYFCEMWSKTKTKTIIPRKHVK